MQRIFRLIVNKPQLVLLLLVLLTVFFGVHARHLRIDSSVEHLLATNDPNKAYAEKIRGLFGSDDKGVIGLVTDNIYIPTILEKLNNSKLPPKLSQSPQV